MDWFSFTATMTGHLAWPAAVLVAIWILRKEASELMRRMKTLKHGNTEILFNEKLKEASEVAEKNNIGTQQTQNQISNEPDEIDQIAAINPSAGFILSFKKTESLIEKIAIKNRLGDITPTKMIDKLEKNDILSRYQLYIFKVLKELRNTAAHSKDGDLTYDEYLEFRILSQKLNKDLQDLLRSEAAT